MGTQPSTEAILLSGRGLVVVKEGCPPDGDGRMLQDCLLKTKAGCCAIVTRRTTAVVCDLFGRCRNSAKTLNTWLHTLQSRIFVEVHRNKTAILLVVCIRQWILHDSLQLWMVLLWTGVMFSFSQGIHDCARKYSGTY
jgi:hypothetical protein